MFTLALHIYNIMIIISNKKMGKIEAEAQITHFSHPHHLTLKSINSSSSSPNPSKCSACKKEASNLVYTCESCNYTLHKICSEMPEKLTHEADGKHALTLLPAAAYSGGAFQCNACGVVGTGFCYHCQDCELDLHPACAFMRQSFVSSAHDHPLKLWFEPPYPEKAFVCDVCGDRGSNHWLFRCGPCGFDAHLKCAKGDRVRIRQPRTDKKVGGSSSGVNAPQPQGQVFRCKSSTFPVFHPSGSSRELHSYGGAPVYAVPSFVVQQPTRNDTVQQVVNSVIEGLIEAGANQLGQALFQGALGN